MSINFKSEEEVKDYIKNIGIEYRFGCFKENKPQGWLILLSNFASSYRLCKSLVYFRLPGRKFYL